MAKLELVEGIGNQYAGQLRGAGVRSTRSLLEKGATLKGRDKIARTAGISGKLILEWVNHVDLFRIKGVGEEYSDLLEEAGVATIGGPDFGILGEGYLRLSYANSADNIRAALARMGDFLRSRN